MRTILLLFGAAALAACAPPPSSVLASGDHPASAEAPATAYVVEAAPLDRAREPDLPSALRAHPGEHGSMGHDEMEHGGNDEMEHDSMEHGAGGHGGEHHAQATAPHDAASPGLAPVLDAYLALHDALAADRLDGVSEHARAFSASFAALTQAPPDGAPHFWHERAAELEAVTEHADALADAGDLAAARVAFGHLSAPFVAVAEALGLPDGVERFRCGMFHDAPESGVWLQRGETVRNPYYGASMLTCGSPQPAPAESGAHSHP